jgi:hypothetical protein
LPGFAISARVIDKPDRTRPHLRYAVTDLLCTTSARGVPSETSKRSAAERLSPMEYRDAPALFAERMADPIGLTALSAFA